MSRKPSRYKTNPGAPRGKQQRSRARHRPLTLTIKPACASNSDLLFQFLNVVVQLKVRPSVRSFVIPLATMVQAFQERHRYRDFSEYTRKLPVLAPLGDRA